MENNKLLVVTPTYNESENIENFVSSVINKDLNLLIIDDNSPDGTGKIVKRLQEEFKNLHLIIRNKKLGLGSAYKEGFQWAIKREFKFTISMDADFSHRIEDLDRLINSLSNEDLILGSRYIFGGSSSGWDKKRKILSSTANKISKKVIRTDINDLTTGFRIYKTDALETIDFGKIQSDGYAFQIEMVFLFIDTNKRIKEIPIIFEERRLGKSKMSKRIVFEAIILLIKLIFRKKNY